MSASVLHTTAVVGDREVLAGLRGGLRGWVHSTFRHVINISSGQPELLTLTGSSVARGPRSIRLGLDRMDHYGVTLGDDVIGDGHTLCVGQGLVVITAATPAWEDATTNGRLVPERISEMGTLLGTPLSSPGTSAFANAVAGRITDSIDALRLAVLDRDEHATHRAAASLVGVGVGVTPTGDDILTGAAFAASRLGGSLDMVHRAVTEVAAQESTNELSLTEMRCALRGRAAQPLEDLYSWLCGAVDDDPRHLMADVKDIAHTSGAALALGLLTAVALHEDPH